jgi:hypothetical protein
MIRLESMIMTLWSVPEVYLLLFVVGRSDCVTTQWSVTPLRVT